MIKLVQTVEKITKAIIIQPNASFIRKGAFFAPIIVLDCLGVAVITCGVVQVEENDIKGLVQEIICLKQKKSKKRVREQT